MVIDKANRFATGRKQIVSTCCSFANVVVWHEFAQKVRFLGGIASININILPALKTDLKLTCHAMRIKLISMSAVLYRISCSCGSSPGFRPSIWTPPHAHLVWFRWTILWLFRCFKTFLHRQSHANRCTGSSLESYDLILIWHFVAIVRLTGIPQCSQLYFAPWASVVSTEHPSWSSWCNMYMFIGLTSVLRAYNKLGELWQQHDRQMNLHLPEGIGNYYSPLSFDVIRQ